MWRQHFMENPLAPLGVVAMALFMAAFLLAVLRARAKPAGETDAMARMPLDDGEVSARHGATQRTMQGSAR